MNAGKTNQPCNQYDSSPTSLYNIKVIVHLSNTPDVGMYLNKSVKFMGQKVENKIMNTKFSCTKILDVHQSLSYQTVTEFILFGTDAGIYK